MTISVEAAPTPWTPTDSSFGARLALIRQRLAWGNVKEAAVACGVPVESWRSWERDGVMPQGSRYFGVCAQIAAVAGCDYGWLVDRRPNGSIEPTDQKVAPKLSLVHGEGRDLRPKSPLLLTVHSSP